MKALDRITTRAARLGHTRRALAFVTGTLAGLFALLCPLSEWAALPVGALFVLSWSRWREVVREHEADVLLATRLRIARDVANSERAITNADVRALVALGYTDEQIIARMPVVISPEAAAEVIAEARRTVRP